MIESKVKSFKNEIRRQSHNKQMERVRYMHWLEENSRYEPLLQTFLCLVAASKLHSNHPSLPTFSELVEFLVSSCKDLNVYILLSHQIIQLDLITLSCSQIDDVALVCQMVGVLVRRPIQSRRGEVQRQIAGDLRSKMIQKSLKSVLARMIQQLRQHTALSQFKKQKGHREVYRECEGISNNDGRWGSTKPEISHQCHTGRMRTIDDIVLLIGDLVADDFKYFQNAELSHQVRGNKSVVLQLVRYIQMFHTHMNQQLIRAYLETIRFLKMQTIHEDSCPSLEGEKLPSLIGQTDQAISQLLHTLFPWNEAESECGGIVAGGQNWLVCLQLIKQMKATGAEHLPVIYSAFQASRNHSSLLVGDKNCLEVLSKISYEQKWVCYSQFRGYFLMVMSQSKLYYQQARNLNIFQAPPFLTTPETESTLLSLQILMVSALINILKNEYSHKCDYDYYQTLEQVAVDLLSTKLLEEWCQSWRMMATLQLLVAQLLNCRNQKLKVEVLGICRGISKWRNVGRDVRRKLELYLKLYKLDCETWLDEDEVWSEETSSFGQENQGYDGQDLLF